MEKGLVAVLDPVEPLMPANPWCQLAHSYGYAADGGLGAVMAYEYDPLFKELFLNLSAVFTVDGRNLQATPASTISGGDVFGRFGRYIRCYTTYGVSEMHLPLRHPPWMRMTTRASMVEVESWTTPRLDLRRSDYAATTTTQQRWRREGNGVPLEPEDRCRGPVARDRRDQLRHVPLPALGLHRQARRHQGSVLLSSLPHLTVIVTLFTVVINKVGWLS